MANPSSKPRKRAEEKQGPHATLIVADVRYTVWFEEVNALLASQLRRATGYSVEGLLQSARAGGGADIDVVAALVWLARVQAGEDNLTFEQVAQKITYATKLDTPDDDEVDDPEDRAAD